MKSKVILILALIIIFGKLHAGDKSENFFHNKMYFGYSYSLASIDRSHGFFYSKALLLNEVQFTNSRIFYGIQIPLNPKYNLRFTQYFKYVTFFDYTNSIQSNFTPYITNKAINRIVTDLEFGFMRKCLIGKTNLNIGISYRWFFIGSEYSYTYRYDNGNIVNNNFNYNYDGGSLSINYVNHNVELGCSFHLIPENHHNFPSSYSKLVLIPEFKGIYIL